MPVFYTKDHEWINIEGNTGTVGITEYAAHQLGDITYVELPKAGKEVKKGAVLCSIESVKAASEIFAPMSGKVTEANQKLNNEPQVVNSSPEADGWIAKLALSDPGEKDGLMDRAKYDAYVKGL